jgi:hypothetical protein
MSNEYKTIQCKLNGKQSVSIPIEVKDRGGKLVTAPIDVIVRGFIKFADSGESVNAIPSGNYSADKSNTLYDKTIVYPVLFTTDKIRTTNGRCVITMVPRSEDLFEDINSIRDKVKVTVSDDSIVEQGGIRTDEQITDPNREPVTIKIEAGVVRYPYKISIEVTAIAVDGSFYSQTVDRGWNPQVDTRGAIESLFFKDPSRVPSNLVINYYNDEQWLPSISSYLSGNNSPVDMLLDEVEDLEHSTPLGLSTFYDAIYLASETLSDNAVDNTKKIIYAFTDNEANVSIHSIDDTIDAVNAIDGNKEVPVMIGNVNIFKPETISIKSNRSDTRNLNRLSYLTDGQSVTINSESYLNDVLAIFYGETVGSIGYGIYEFTVDLEEEVLINSITANVSVPVDTGNVTWTVETSRDGYTFTALGNTYGYSDNILVDDLRGRYIKFKFVFITSIQPSSNPSDNPSNTYLDSPSLNGVQIVYSKTKIAYLYLNVQDDNVNPYHVVLAVDANYVNQNQISAGVAKSDSSNWEDYQSSCQPSVNQNGKVVIPIRFSQDTDEFQHEPLNKVDNFMLVAEHGRWDPFASVILYDHNGDVISTDRYTISPREGAVILNFAVPSAYVDGDYKVGILNSDKYKIGLKLQNRSKDTSLEIYGIGYMYSSGKDLLPPIAKSPPEARNVEITNESPNRFSPIAVTYDYYDSNYDPEDVANRKVKWYINGSPIKYLENLLSWNDLNNPNDPLYKNTDLDYPSTEELGEDSLETWAKKQTSSILYSNDTIYCEIQVTDGNLSSTWYKSNMVTVIESTPVMGIVSIKSKDVITNKVMDRVCPEFKAVLDPPLSQVFYSDSNVNTSDIVWYVNDEVFKRGRYGDPKSADGWSIDEIGINEVGKDVYIDYGLRIGNQILCQITPRTGSSVGETIVVGPVTVNNSLPKVVNVNWNGTNRNRESSQVLSWNFNDFETISLRDVDETQQSDQTTIKLYRKNPGSSTSFELVYLYNDHSRSPIVKETFLQSSYQGAIITRFNTSGSSLTISGSILKVANQQWYAEILPHDSIEYGTTVISTTITIL